MIAQMRHTQNTGIKDNKVSDKRSEDINYLGVVGEYAFCKRMNVCPDLSTESRKNGYDCTYKDKRWDIKATECRTGHLLIPSTKNNPDVDVYALAIIDGFHVELIGWAYKTDLMQPENLKDLGKGLSYMLTQQQLRKFKQDLQHA
jgi:hypothetical protein